MIVVIGPVGRASRGGGLAGLAAGVARAAVAAGREVQVACGVPAGDPGDAIVLGLARAGIGHAAILRGAASSGAPTLGPEDLELALRYVTSFDVLVLAEPGRPDLVPVAAEAAAFAGAHLLVLVAPGGSTVASDAAAGITVLEAPGRDPEGAFAAVVGGYAAELDVGVVADVAWAAVSARLGLEVVRPAAVSRSGAR